jgi:anti-sigma factor RsiW
MNRKPLHTDNSWENDAVWKLLDQTPPATPGPRFVEDTVRAARLAGQAQPWWQRLLSPAPLTGLAAATAALVFAAVGLLGPASGPANQTAMLDAKQAAAIQDIAESETLIAAVDHLDDFSDTELVSLIGF